MSKRKIGQGVSKSDLDLIRQHMSDPWWRLTSGALYKIVDKTGSLVPFIPNRAQLRLLREMHTRNIIPKARQLGLSTAIQILMLDTALFQDNCKSVVVAHDLASAEEIFRSKLKRAYGELPTLIRQANPLQTDSKTSLDFPHGSSVTVSTSARSGTCMFLHVSEMGKIAAKFPDKAKEIVTGSIPAVTPNGMIFIESTAEGRDGEFYKMVETAKKLQDSGAALTPLDFKLHFFGWYDDDNYRLPASSVHISDEMQAYFDGIEHQIGVQIDQDQRAWYVKTLAGFGNDAEKMHQEYPSTFDEAFELSLEGCYYTEQLSQARKDGRIGNARTYDDTLPVSTYWDIGGNDNTAIWCVQHCAGEIRCIDYHEATGEPFLYFVQWLRGRGYDYDTHYLPHDADNTRQQGIRNQSPREMILDLAPDWHIEIVPRINDVIIGIQQVRSIFPRIWIDDRACATGLRHLELYRKEWDDKHACWRNRPLHDIHSDCADAFRQIAQSLDLVDTGKPIYAGVYSDSLHMSPAEFLPLANRDAVIGFHLGSHPVAIIAQVTQQGQLRIIDEMSADSAEHLLDDLLVPLLASKYMQCQISGYVASDAPVKALTAYQGIKHRGINVKPLARDDFHARIDAVRYYLSRLQGGKPAIAIAPSCRKVRYGFTSGYKFKQLPAGLASTPEQNESAGYHDALQTICLALRNTSSQPTAPTTRKHVIVDTITGY